MPSRNTIKQYGKDCYYHVYNRGVNRRSIFRRPEDYSVFLNLLKRYLSSEEITDLKGRPYVKLHDDIELLAYCLMSNHYHLLIYQKSPEAMSDLMQRVMTAYAAYFNNQYSRVGPLCQGRYKASLIDNDAYLWHISRYIHRNPTDGWQNYDWSSYAYYRGDKQADWVSSDRVLEAHNQRGSDYATFMLDDDEFEDSLDWLATSHLAHP